MNQSVIINLILIRKFETISKMENLSEVNHDLSEVPSGEHIHLQKKLSG